MKVVFAVVKIISGGLIRKRAWRGEYAPILFIPLSKHATIMTALIAELTDEVDAYACQLITIINTSNIDKQIKLEKEAAEDERKMEFEVIEEIPCTSEKAGENDYRVTLKKRGKYVRSDLKVRISEALSQRFNTNIFVVNGDINYRLERGTVNTIGMLAKKQRAILQSLGLFKGKKILPRIRGRGF